MATQTQVSGPSAEFMPYYNSLLQGAFNYANQPYQQYPGQRVAGMSDIQYQALSGIQNSLANDPMSGVNSFYANVMGGGGSPMMNQAMAGMQGQANNPILGQAQGLYGNLMAGGGNPFMDQMIGDVTNQATRAYQQATGSINNRFTNPNSFGGSRHAMMQDQANEAFARGLGSALGNLQYNAHGEGLDRQMRASQMATGLQNQQYNQLLQNFRAGGEGLDRQMAGAQGLQGAQRQRFNDLLASLQAGNLSRIIQQQQYDVGYQDWQNAQRYPLEMIDRLSGVLSGTRSNQTTMSQPGPNQASQMLGGVAGILPLLLSGFDFFKGTK